MKKGVFLLVLFLLLSAGSAHAFSTADIRPDYNSLLYGVQVGDNGLNALRLGFDFGLTHTVGMEAILSYTGGDFDDNWLDLGTKFRLTEGANTNVSGRVGFHGRPIEDWLLSVGLQVDQEFTSFFKMRAGANISFVEEWGWSYFVGGDYELSPSLSIQGGVFKNIRQEGLGDFLFGLRTRL